MFENCRRNLAQGWIEAAQHSERSREIQRRINRRSRGNDVERIAEDVGNDQGDQSSGLARPSEPASFDLTESFSHGVQLFNVGACRAEPASDCELVFERDSLNWRRKEGRAAAGEKTNAEIV